jgi:hypothetical protein
MLQASPTPGSPAPTPARTLVGLTSAAAPPPSCAPPFWRLPAGAPPLPPLRFAPLPLRAAPSPSGSSPPSAAAAAAPPPPGRSVMAASCSVRNWVYMPVRSSRRSSSLNRSSLSTDWGGGGSRMGGGSGRGGRVGEGAKVGGAAARGRRRLAPARPLEGGIAPLRHSGNARRPAPVSAEQRRRAHLLGARRRRVGLPDARAESRGQGGVLVMRQTKHMAA